MGTMIGIFALLFIAMTLIVKYCKKKVLKTTLAVVIILITVYCVMMSIDMNRVHSLRKPVFAISTEMREHENNSIEIYKGLGYKIEIQTTMHNQQIVSMTMYWFFNTVIAGVIT